MPELPEVETTATGVARHTVGLTIVDVWSNYASAFFVGSDTIKDRTYFKKFKKLVVGGRITSVRRRAKNILIELTSGTTILVHMKMTGHLLYGVYRFVPAHRKDPWEPISPPGLKDPFNRNVHFILTFNNGKYLALSDVRKFAKVTAISTVHLPSSDHLRDLGPEPLERAFTYTEFVKRLKLRSKSPIKQVLMDQRIISGIGNIYADESLWRAGINPLERVAHVTPTRLKVLYQAIRRTLSRGIDFGGDSTSDYRNVHGEKGEFHEHHYAYQRTGTKCKKRGCGGTIVRIVVGGRGTHYCDRHQRISISKNR